MLTAVEVRAQAVLHRLPIGAVRGAEIGVFAGGMSQQLLQRPDLSLIMVDSWEGDGAAYAEGTEDYHGKLPQNIQDTYMRAASAYTEFACERRSIMRCRSIEAAQHVEDGTLDFAFIDADHSEQGCSADIAAWWPKVREGGLLCGHDYGHVLFSGVKTAVDDFAKREGKRIDVDADCTWFIRKAVSIEADRIALNHGKLVVQLRPPVHLTPEKMMANMQSALARGLREVRACKAHGEILSIASGGPSLADTYKDMQGHIAAANGSLGYLLGKGIVPHFCGVMDANEHMAGIVAADPRVYYFLSSNCDPSLFDKVLNAGCDIRLWHPTPDNIGEKDGQFVVEPNAGFALQGKAYPDKFVIGGGTSIGQRLIHIGYVLGYRKFHMHGNDASFRGTETHAYWDRRWGDWVERSSIEINGYRTSLNFMQHVTSFANLIARLQGPEFEPTEIEVFGDGLLQSCYRHWLAHKDIMSPQEAFQQW